MSSFDERSSHLDLFWEKAALKYFAKLIRKHLRRRSSFDKKAMTQVLLLWIFKIFQKNFFIKHLWESTSGRKPDYLCRGTVGAFTVKLQLESETETVAGGVL